MSKTLLSFCGWPGCGKSTASNVLREFGFEVKSFASPLKEMTKEILQVETLNKKEHRNAMILLGTGYMRGQMSWQDLTKQMQIQYDINKDDLYERVQNYVDENFEDNEYIFTDIFWTKVGLENLPQKVVFDDLRFLIEADEVRKIGGKIVKLETTIEKCIENLVKRDGGFQEDLFTLPSEIEWKDIKHDYALLANKEFLQFEENIRNLAQILGW